MAGRHPVEPLDGIGFIAGAEFAEPFGGFGELGEELGGDFGADFVAAAADRGADGGEEVDGLGFELHLHLADGFDDDAGEGTAPAGVDGGDGTLFGVDEENGDAVGGLDGEEEAGTVGGQGVALAGSGGRAFEEMDYVGVDLLEGDELEVGGAESGLEAEAIFEDVFFGVTFGEAEIQYFFAVELAGTAGFCAETVDEPGKFCEDGGLEDFEAV